MQAHHQHNYKSPIFYWYMALDNLSQLNVPFFCGFWQVNQYHFQGIHLRMDLHVKKNSKWICINIIGHSFFFASPSVVLGFFFFPNNMF